MNVPGNPLATRVKNILNNNGFSGKKFHDISSTIIVAMILNPIMINLVILLFCAVF